MFFASLVWVQIDIANGTSEDEILTCSKWYYNQYNLNETAKLSSRSARNSSYSTWIITFFASLVWVQIDVANGTSEDEMPTCRKCYQNQCNLNRTAKLSHRSGRNSLYSTRIIMFFCIPSLGPDRCRKRHLRRRNADVQ